MRNYELRFITEHGRVIRGPIFKRDKIAKYKDLVKSTDTATRISMTYGCNVVVILRAAMKRGHFRIKPVGRLYTMVRWLRS